MTESVIQLTQAKEIGEHIARMLMSENSVPEFGEKGVPVAVAARVFGKDATWIQGGIISGMAAYWNSDSRTNGRLQILNRWNQEKEPITISVPKSYGSGLGTYGEEKKMQAEAIKYQPPVEDVVITQEEEKQILKLGRIAGEQLRQSHKDVRLFGRLSTVMAFLLGMETVLLLVACGIVTL